MEPTTIPPVLTRQQLYERVWQTPATKLAGELGITNVAVYEACDRHGIPRPSTGHWSLVRAGYVVERPPLPPAAVGAPDIVTFDRPTKSSRPSPPTSPAGEQSPTPSSPPAEKGAPPEKPHPLTKLIGRRLRAAKQDASKLVSPEPKEGPEIRVARASIDRALAIVDALVKGWERQGGSVSIEEPRGGYERSVPNLRFAVDPDNVALTITERTERDLDWKPPKDAYWQPRPPSRPTGRLVVSLVGAYGSGSRGSWGDGTRQRVEGCIDSILEGIRQGVDHNCEFRLDKECEKRQERRAAERREIAQAAAKQERARRLSLSREVRAWQRARLIREFLAAVHERDVREGVVPSERRAEALGWSARYADHIDPLLRGPPPTAGLQPSDVSLAEVELTRDGRRAVEALGVTTAKQLSAVTREQLRTAVRNEYGPWAEFTRVLEGLGYDVSERGRW